MDFKKLRWSHVCAHRICSKHRTTTSFVSEDSYDHLKKVILIPVAVGEGTRFFCPANLIVSDLHDSKCAGCARVWGIPENFFYHRSTFSRHSRALQSDFNGFSIELIKKFQNFGEGSKIAYSMGNTGIQTSKIII